MVQTRSSTKRKRSSTSPEQKSSRRIAEKPTKPQLPPKAGVSSEARRHHDDKRKTSLGASNPIIFTVGHGTRTLSELVALLQSAQITKLVDVRSIPRSRTNPQFNRNVLTSSLDLRAVGIEYLWFGHSLGGRQKKSARPDNNCHTAIRTQAFKNYADYMSSEPFSKGLDELKALAESNMVAFMCSETLWWRCHRRMISDRLVADGWQVLHLGVQKIPVQHKMWDIARLDGNDLVYDDR